MTLNTVAEARTRQGDFLRVLDSFLLSRQVEGNTDWTYKTYQKRLALFFVFVTRDGPRDLAGITRRDVELFLRSFQLRQLSPHYVDGNYRSLRAFFNWSVHNELIPSSPMRHMKAPRLPKRGKPFMTESQRDRLLAMCPADTLLGDRDAALIWLLWGSGMRLEECLNLGLEDLDWPRGTARIFGKGQKERLAPFTMRARIAVIKYLDHRADELPGLWVTEEIRPMSRSGMVSAMRRLIERSGQRGEIRDLFHIFRRTWARRMMQKTPPVSLKYIQQAGGWATLAS